MLLLLPIAKFGQVSSNGIQNFWVTCQYAYTKHYAEHSELAPRLAALQRKIAASFVCQQLKLRGCLLEPPTHIE